MSIIERHLRFIEAFREHITEIQDLLGREWTETSEDLQNALKKLTQDQEEHVPLHLDEIRERFEKTPAENFIEALWQQCGETSDSERGRSGIRPETMDAARRLIVIRLILEKVAYLQQQLQAVSKNDSPVEQWVNQLVERVEGREIMSAEDLLHPPQAILDLQKEKQVLREAIITHQQTPIEAQWKILAYLSQWDRDWLLRRLCLVQLEKLSDLMPQASYALVLEASALHDTESKVRKAAIDYLKAILAKPIQQLEVAKRIQMTLNRVTLCASPHTLKNYIQNLKIA